MRPEHSRIIILLLSGILAVLLFGRDAVLGSLNTILPVALAIGLVGLVAWALYALFAFLGRQAKKFGVEAKEERSQGRPWLHNFLTVPGMLGNFVVMGLAGWFWWAGDLRFREALQLVPLWWVPVMVLLLGIPALWLETMWLSFRSKGRSVASSKETNRM
jgi:hypothetical protein